MNLRIVSGYLTQPAAPAFVPPAQGAQAVRKVLFDLHVRDSQGREFPEKCVIEDPFLQKATELKLIAGAFILIDGEPTARPFEKQGVRSGWVREIIVRKIEFIRVPKAAATPGDDAIMTGGGA